MRRALAPLPLASLPLAALLLAGVVRPGRADTPAQAGARLAPVVVTATRVPTPAADIPAGVTIITRAEMERRGDNTLTDALAAVPGLRVSQSGGPGGNASVFVRGTNSNAVLVLRDGMPLNNSADSSGAFNFGIETLADVARIEVIRGPMAALYGSGAIGGVINIITRRGDRPGAHLSTDLAGGYPQQIRASAVLSGTRAGFDYALIAQSESLRGYDTTPQRMSIYTGTPQGYRDQLVTLNLGYTPVPGTRVSLLLRARQAVYGFNALGSPTFDDANSTGRDASLLGRIGVHSRLAGGTWETGLFLGRLQDDRRYTEPLHPADPNQASNDSRYHGDRTDLQWNNTVHLSDLFTSAVLSQADLTFGYERTADSAKVRVASSFAGFPYAQSADAAVTDDAVYAGLQGRLWRRLTLTGQLRHDQVLNDRPTTWRLGAVLDAPALRTRFKAAYGTAFRAPSLFDRFGVDFVWLCRQPEPSGRTRARLGGWVHHHPAGARAARFRGLRRHLFQRADRQPDRDRVRPRLYGGEHRLGAYPGGGDDPEPASGALARARCQLDLHPAGECRYRRLAAAPAAEHRGGGCADHAAAGPGDRAAGAAHRRVPRLSERQRRIRHRHDRHLRPGGDRQPDDHLSRHPASQAVSERHQPVRLPVRAGERLPDPGAGGDRRGAAVALAGGTAEGGRAAGARLC